MSRRLPLIAGTSLIAAFFVVVHARLLAPTLYSPVGTSRLPWTVMFVCLILAAAYAMGLPELPASRLGAAGAALAAGTSGILGVSLAQTALGTALLPRLVLGGVWAVFVPWALICWNAEHDRVRRSQLRALFVGNEQEFAELRADLAGDLVPAVLDGPVAPPLPGEPLPDRVLSRLRAPGVDMIILDMASMANAAIVAEVSELHRRGIRVRTPSLFSEEYLGKIPLADLERVSLLFDIGEVHRSRYLRWKRMIDVSIGAVAMIALLPVGVIVLAGNAVGNRGPLLYRQPRIGKNGTEFEILKFRSMRSSSGGPTQWTATDDPRITPFGSFLRRSHLDELPQAWNILRGDLSIVGPRPEQPHYVGQLAEKIPFYETRHLVRPGLTGWAQVNYPYGADEVDAREKLQYDLYYLRRQSPRLDIQILVRTLRAVVGRTGR